MDAVLNPPGSSAAIAEPDLDPIVNNPTIDAPTTASVKRLRSGVGYCQRCKSFTSSKRPHTAADCDANIAKRAAGRRSPKTRRKVRITPKRLQNMKKLAQLAAIGAILAPKVERLRKIIKGKSYSKNKRLVNSVESNLKVTDKSLNEKIHTMARSIGL